jgi:hypothetical protein
MCIIDGKTENASHHQSGDRTSNRFIPAKVELAEPPIGEERVNIRLTDFNFITSTKQPCIAQFALSNNSPSKKA